MRGFLSTVTMLFSLILVPGVVMAQKPDTMTGTLEVNQDMRVDVLLNKHIEINQVKQTMEGFRIQVFFDSGNSSKARAQAALDEFIARYPKISAYLTFKSPNYKVRVGDFRTRLDAQRFLNDIVADYPNAFIIADQINLSNVE